MLLRLLVLVVLLTGCGDGGRSARRVLAFLDSL